VLVKKLHCTHQGRMWSLTRLVWYFFRGEVAPYDVKMTWDGAYWMIMKLQGRPLPCGSADLDERLPFPFRREDSLDGVEIFVAHILAVVRRWRANDIFARESALVLVDRMVVITNAAKLGHRRKPCTRGHAPQRH
jgi:hypothetical protein